MDVADTSAFGPDDAEVADNVRREVACPYSTCAVVEDSHRDHEEEGTAFQGTFRLLEAGDALGSEDDVRVNQGAKLSPLVGHWAA
jgi:hypothetical protein